MINGQIAFENFRSFFVSMQEQGCQNCKTAFEYKSIFFKALCAWESFYTR